MAKISLLIDSNAKQASADMQGYNASIDKNQEKVKKLQEQYEKKGFDTFIEKQKRIAEGMRATGQQTQVLSTYQANLTSEIKRLINTGIDPKSKALRRLQAELKQTQKVAMTTGQAMTKMSGMIKNAGMYVGLAVGGFVALINKTGEAGDKIAKTSKMIGMSAETLQELSFAAERQGVKSELMTESLIKLNKITGDVKAGTSGLIAKYKDLNPELINLLKNSTSTEQAFLGVMEILKGYGSDAEKATVINDLFSESGVKMINLLNTESKELAGLRNEKRQYGLITNEQAAQAELYADAVSNLKASFGGLVATLSGDVLPVFTDMAKYLTAIINDNKELADGVSRTAKNIVAFTGAMVGALVIAKAVTIVNGLNEALAVTRVLLKSTAGTAIGFVAAIGATAWAVNEIVRNFELVEIRFKQFKSTIGAYIGFIARSVEIFAIYLGENIKGTVTKTMLWIEKTALNAQKTAMNIAYQAGYIGDEAFLPVAEAADKATAAYNNFDSAQKNNIDTTKMLANAYGQLNADIAEANEKTDTALDKFYSKAPVVTQFDKVIKDVKELIFGTEKATEQMQKLKIEITSSGGKSNAGTTTGGSTPAPKPTQGLFDTSKVEQYIEKIKQLNATEMQIEQDFYNTKNMGLQDYVAKKYEIESEYRKINKDAEFKMADEILKKKLENNKKEDESNKRIQWSKADWAKWGFNTTATFIEGLSILNDKFEKDRVKAAKQAKLISIAQAGINTALAVTTALSQPTPAWWINLVNAGMAATLGGIQIAAIAAEPIPAAETGLDRFVVPEGRTNRTDNVGMRVNAGEEVTVKPRSAQGNETTNIRIEIGKESIFRVIQRGFLDGDLYVTGANIR